MEKPFAHATHTHHYSSGMLLRVDFSGLYAWGEAAPRSYVTGESVLSVENDIRNIDITALAKDLDLNDLGRAIIVIGNIEQYFDGEGQLGRCARCLIELALLDALLKHQNISFSDLYYYLRPEVTKSPGDSFHYTFVTGLKEADSFIADLAGGKVAMPKRIKIKVDSNLDAAEKTISEIRKMSSTCEVALDVNEGWNFSQLMEAGRRFAPYKIACIEEPLAARSWTKLAEFRQQYRIPIMLDESFYSAEDIEAAERHQAFDVLNIRLSKCGGFLESLRFIDIAKKLNRSVYLGVHVGEVGPLWACQRALASCEVDKVGVEIGKQDQWFSQSTTVQTYQVDRKSHTAQVVPGFGHGVEPSSYLMSHASRVAEMIA